MVPIRKQLRQPIMDAVAPRQRIEQAAGVGHLRPHIFLRVGAAGIFQPAVRIGNLVPVKWSRRQSSTLALGGPAGGPVAGAELSAAHASAAIRERQATIQSKREPPGIKHLTESDVHRRQGLGYQNSNRAVLSNSAPDANINNDSAGDASARRAPPHSSVAQWQSIRLLTEGL